MTTEKQLEANKLNALKSTGPRTFRGKANTSRNAIKHGLRSNTDDIILGNESTRKYNRFYEALFVDLAPVGPKETILADRIINFYWKLKRVARMETQTFRLLNVTALDKNPHIKQLRSLRAAKKDIPRDLDRYTDFLEENELGEMAISNFASRGQESGRSLENIQNYESRIERSLYKAQLEFHKLQFIRRQNEAKNETNPTL